MTRKEFSQYVEVEYPALYRFVKSRISSPQDAEDVLQRTLLKLLGLCHAIDAGSPHGFFFTALRNGIIDYWRKRGRRPPESELPEQVAANDESSTRPSEGPDIEAHARQVLAEAAAALTARERRSFTVYWGARGDRTTALEELGLAEASKEEKYRVYDGPLFHARRKLAQVLTPASERFADIGYARLWELIHEVLSGTSPDMG